MYLNVRILHIGILLVYTFNLTNLTIAMFLIHETYLFKCANVRDPREVYGHQFQELPTTPRWLKLNYTH